MKIPGRTYRKYDICGVSRFSGTKSGGTLHVWGLLLVLPPMVVRSGVSYFLSLGFSFPFIPSLALQVFFQLCGCHAGETNSSRVLLVKRQHSLRVSKHNWLCVHSVIIQTSCFSYPPAHLYDWGRGGKWRGGGGGGIESNVVSRHFL